MKLSKIISALEEFAPPTFQESYDNVGLLIGNNDMDITGAIICLDSTLEVIEEAIQKKCNLVIAHHPIIFSGLKQITGKNYIERIILKAIKSDIAIYVAHTNLDNVRHGVNGKIGELLGIKKRHILLLKNLLIEKLVTYTPLNSSEKVRNSLFDAGGGEIGAYSNCSFNSIGEGTFKASKGANPFIGKLGQLHIEDEKRIEITYLSHNRTRILTALKESHPYEEIAYEIYKTENKHQLVGSGMYGELDDPMDIDDFFNQLKSIFNLKIIRHTKKVRETVKKIAWCGGAGSFLSKEAMGIDADVFVTSDYKYHDFFEYQENLVIADIGHYESEQFTIDLISDFLNEKFPKFAVHLTEVNTNPVNYY